MKNLLLNLILVAGTTALTRADATFQLANNVASRFRYENESGQLLLLPVGTPVVIGFFWGDSLTSISDTAALPLGTMSTTTPGLVNPFGLPSPWLVLPGVEPFQPVWAQVRGWKAEFGLDWRAARDAAPELYAETDIRQVIGGPPTGPPGVLWQNGSQTHPNRFPALIFPVPEPSTLALGALGGLVLLLRVRKSGKE
jgi:hypothetical protein